MFVQLERVCCHGNTGQQQRAGVHTPIFNERLMMNTYLPRTSDFMINIGTLNSKCVTKRGGKPSLSGNECFISNKALQKDKHGM